jgi:hypothetical protein
MAGRDGEWGKGKVGVLRAGKLVWVKQKAFPWVIFKHPFVVLTNECNGM